MNRESIEKSEKKSPPWALGLAVALAAGFVWAPCLAAQGARPNIVFLLADDLRWDALGFAGNDIVQTPNLDALAARGTVFSNSFGTTPVCYASRATLLTGQYNRRHHVDSFADALSPEQFAATYPAILRRAGYATGFIGKWGLGGELPASEFDVWAGFEGQGNYFEPGDPEHLTSKQGRKAVEFVSTAREPFLLTVAFKAPHVQDGGCSCTLPTDPADDGLYQKVTIPVAPTFSDAAFAALPPFLQESEGRRRFPDQIATPAAYQEWVKDYYRLITGMDRAIGQVIAALEARGVRGRTLIVFTSDNGLLIGEHGLTGKWLMFDESIRVPLVVDWPGLPAARRGKKSFRMAENVDLAATFLDAAGVTRPSEMQGESLKPLVFGQNLPWRRDAYYEHQLTWPFIPKGEAVRGARWKYVRYNSEAPPYEQLFDLQADPREEHDILHTPALFDRLPWFYRRQLMLLRARWRELRESLGTDQAPAEAQAIGCHHVLDPVAVVSPPVFERLFQN